MEDKLIKSIQEKELLILDKTIEILNDNDIEWFAGYGTLLGAIREGGFIPWDNDIDIIVPRKCFNRICSGGEKWFNKPLFLETPMNSGILRHYIKVRLDGTTDMRKEHYGSKNHFGMSIDIFPIDHIPEDERRKESTLNVIFELRNYLRFPMYGVSNELSDFTVDKINCSYMKLMWMIDNNNINSNSVVETGFPYFSREENISLPGECFSEYSNVSFRGLKNKLRIPNTPEKLLELWYGKDWRVPKNFGKFSDSLIDPNKDYSHYMNLSKEEFDKIFDRLIEKI